MRTPTRRIAWLLVAAILGAGTFVVWLRLPESHGLVRLLGYTILTNTYISFLPYEPVFFYYASLHAPLVITLMAGLGALVTGIIDWETLNPLLHAQKVRKLYANTRVYRWSVKWYGKAPFWTIVFAALTPFPYYPIKFLALASGYPEGRYLTALMVGRLPRFYIYASVGHALNIPNWLLILTFVVMLGIGVWAKARQWAEERRSRAAGVCPVPTAASCQPVQQEASSNDR